MYKVKAFYHMLISPLRLKNTSYSEVTPRGEMKALKGWEFGEGRRRADSL